MVDDGDIDEAQASGEVARIYGDILEVGGYGSVPLLFRRLAVRADCLGWAWSLLRPGYLHGAMTRLAAGLPLHPPAVVPIAAPLLQAQGLSVAQLRQARDITRAFNAANPKNLLAARVVSRAAATAEVPDWGDAAAPDAPRAEIPRLPEPVSLDSLTAEARALLDWLSSTGGRRPTPLMPTLYRMLAQDMSLLTLIASRLDPLFADGTVERVAGALQARADALCGRLEVTRGPALSTGASRFVVAATQPFHAKVAEMLAVGAVICALLSEVPEV
ncbi:MAG: hypothetical protein Kilf2KO_11010 [Rhodospirillales bacterium]